jgi:hypothetical protein
MLIDKPGYGCISIFFHFNKGENELEDRTYYVYAYLRENDGSPYYVGKGKGRRKYEKHSVSVPSDKSKIRILAENLTNVEAVELEKFYIATYGRKDLGTGILHNQTDGGDGGDTSKSTRYIEAKNKNLFSNKGRKFSKEHKERIARALTGKSRPDSVRKKISDTRKSRKIPGFFKGKKFSIEHREKLSLSRKNRPTKNIEEQIRKENEK